MRRGKTRSSPTGLDGSLKPLQRFSCRSCDSTFTSERKTARPRAGFSDAVGLEAVRLYVQGLTSYRVLASMLEQRLGRSVSALHLERLGDRAGRSGQDPARGVPGVGAELGWVPRHRRQGDLRPGRQALPARRGSITQPRTSCTPSWSRWRPPIESSAWRRGTPRCRSSAAGVICDLGPGFVQAHRDHFGATPFQACRVHFDRRLDSDIPRSRWSAKAPLYAELKVRVRAILCAPTYDEACRLLAELGRERARFKGIGKYDTIRTLQRNFDVYTAHHHTPGLPADTNFTENVIKQLNKKLRLMEGFESLGSAERYVRLLVGCYRFKRFTDSCRRADNGKAPLQLAGVDLAGRDWLSYLIDR